MFFAVKSISQERDICLYKEMEYIPVEQMLKNSCCNDPQLKNYFYCSAEPILQNQDLPSCLLWVVSIATDRSNLSTKDIFANSEGIVSPESYFIRSIHP